MYKKSAFSLGREALRDIIKTYGIKNLHIPYYLCDVVRHTLAEEHCKPIFYHIDDNFFPTKIFTEKDYILYPNYWGICRENVKKLTEKYPRVIVDNAHAFFDEPSGFACFNAGHKFGFKNSYAFKWKGSSQQAQTDYLPSDIIEKRKIEFLNLHNKYKEINLLKIDLSSIPFCYPCLVDTVENADKLVRSLKKEGKTIYRYWNALPINFNEYKFYSRLVPIPIVF